MNMLLPPWMLHVVETIEAESKQHQQILVSALRYELNKRWPVFGDIESLDESVRMEAYQVAHFPGATDGQMDAALGREERCIHALRESLDFHDDTESVGPVVVIVP